MLTKSILTARLVDEVYRSDRFRLVRYLFAGLTVSLGYTFTIIGLVNWLGVLGPEAANIVSLMVWTVTSYLAHREFTFGFVGEYAGSAVRFVVVFLLKLIASIVVIAVITRYYQSSYLIGVAVNWVVLPLVSYIALKLWVFQRAQVQ